MIKVKLGVLKVLDRGYEKVLSCREIEGDGAGKLKDPVELVFDDLSATDGMEGGDVLELSLTKVSSAKDAAAASEKPLRKRPPKK